MDKTTLPLTANETVIIENLYKKGKNKFQKSVIIVLSIWLFILFVPSEFWNFMKSFVKRRYNQNEQNYSEQMYQNLPISITISIVVALIIFFYYYANIYYQKKDLKAKLKTRKEYTVVEIKHFDKKLSDSLDGFDSSLYLEKKGEKIYKHLFKRNEKPEFLKAKKIVIEKTLHNNFILFEEVIN
jgi:heme/copper-type cytochrome/quinol oxidase subunit 2